MTVEQRRGVFLDRDGVLIGATVAAGRPRPPATLSDAQVLPNVAAACHTLRASGAVLVVVTNQPDLARGTTTVGEVTAINRALQRALPLDDIVVCPHDDADKCACRKPQPGMILDAAARLNIDLRRSVMIGDRWRDIEAGARAGCRTVFVDRNYCEPQPESPDLVVREFPDALPWILSVIQEEADCA